MNIIDTAESFEKIESNLLKYYTPRATKPEDVPRRLLLRLSISDNLILLKFSIQFILEVQFFFTRIQANCTLEIVG